VKRRLLFLMLLVAYSLLLVNVMVFKNLPTIRIGYLMLNFSGTHEAPPNFIPFKTILPYLFGHKGLIIAGINIIGNIILLVPIGFLIPYLLKEMNWKKAILFAVLSGLVIEGLQTILHVGIFDIDDVILNGLGFMIGYWKFLVFPRCWNLLRTKKIFLASVIMIVTLVAYYIFNFFQNNSGPMPRGPGFRNERVNHIKNNNAVARENDLCGGTGGTGQIIGKSDHAITIKRNDGIEEIIHLSDKTSIKNSSGNITEVDLRMGDRVTVVVGLIPEDPLAASLVLVCH